MLSRSKVYIMLIMPDAAQRRALQLYLATYFQEGIRCRLVEIDGSLPNLSMPMPDLMILDGDYLPGQGVWRENLEKLVADLRIACPGIGLGLLVHSIENQRIAQALGVELVLLKGSLDGPLRAYIVTLQERKKMQRTEE